MRKEEKSVEGKNKNKNITEDKNNAFNEQISNNDVNKGIIENLYLLRIFILMILYSKYF